MKFKHVFFIATVAWKSAAYGTPVLLGGFDGSNETALQSSAISAVAVTLTSSTGDITQGFSQIDGILWGTTDLDVDATIQTPNALGVVGSPSAFTLTLTITNNGDSDLSLDKIHFIVKKDIANEGPNAVTITYIAGDLGAAGSSTVVGIPNGTIGHDVSLAGFLADTTLSNAESATFTWATGAPENPAGNTGLRVDNFAISGSASGAPDTTAPTPNPMTWADVPAPASDSSITMTATTARDPSGVEYYFTNLTLINGSHDSGWQDSPAYTDTGLDAETSYAYTVNARDKSTAQNVTDSSTPVAVGTTNAVYSGPILLGGFDGNNAVNAPIQSPGSVGKISMELSATTTLAGAFPGAGIQSSSLLWGTTDLDPDADDSNNGGVLIADEPLELLITITNTSTDQDVELDTLHWISKRDTSDSPTTATITFASGSLTDSLGTNATVSLLTVGTTGHDYALSGMLSDRVLAPGETTTFKWTTSGANTAGNDRLRMDNIALSGSFLDSDYISWSSEQSWTAGDPATSGNDDYDGDGLSNDDERKFGLNPTDASSRNPISTPLDPLAGTLSYTRRSQSITGLNYPVWYSTDLVEWFRDIFAVEAPGASANDIEIVDVTINPVLLSESKLFLQLRPEPPVTLPAPELINVAGNNTSISLNFTQVLYQLTATDTANYTVELAGGGSVSVTGASLGENGKTVTLTLGSTLTLASAYNVSFNNLTGATGAATAGSSTGQFETWDNDPTGIKVFILAGQSNMVGYGHSETGNGGVVGAIGSLRYLANNNDTYPEYDYASLLDNPADPVNSVWASRSDVKVWGENGTSGNLGSGIRKGNLDPSQGATNGTYPWFGPEYAFGQIIGDYYASDDVLIIKTSWGGHSLGGNFRPPSAVADRGGEVGASYLKSLENVREVLDHLGTEFPEWAGRGYQIVGCAWHQGWSDLTEPFSGEYRDNLPDLISDLRLEFGKPNLPFVIATTGMGGNKPIQAYPYPDYSNVEKAQLWVAGVRQPLKVLSSDTRSFWEEVADSPRDQNFHWNQNARSYFRVGKVLGEDMVNLLSAP